MVTDMKQQQQQQKQQNKTNRQTNRHREGSGNVTGLKFENLTRTRSPI